MNLSGADHKHVLILQHALLLQPYSPTEFINSHIFRVDTHISLFSGP